MPPNAKAEFHQLLRTYIATLCTDTDKLVLLGDFNYPDICWHTLTGESSQSSLFCELVFEFNLLQHVEGATHIKGVQ